MGQEDDVGRKTANKLGNWSLFLGFASFLCICFTGIPAVVVGLMAVVQGDGTTKVKGAIGAGLGGFITLLMVIGMIVAPPAERSSGLDWTTPATSAPKAEPPPAPVKPAFDKEVDAVTLWKAYDANEVAADNAYKGKKLKVTGKVQSIDKDFMGTVVLRLQSPNEFMATAASIEEEDAGKAATLRKGQQVAVICEGAGLLVGSPQLNECRIQ